MLQWLLSDCSVFGWPVQNWIWVLPCILALYAAGTVFIRTYRAPTQP